VDAVGNRQRAAVTFADGVAYYLTNSTDGDENAKLKHTPDRSEVVAVFRTGV